MEQEKKQTDEASERKNFTLIVFVGFILSLSKKITETDK